MHPIKGYFEGKIDNFKSNEKYTDTTNFVKNSEHYQKFHMNQEEECTISTMKEKGTFYTRDLPSVPEMVFIPTGEVWLGCSNFNDKWNKPMVKVKIDAFYISKYEITKSQYYDILELKKKDSFEYKKNNPISFTNSSYTYDKKKRNSFMI